MSMKPATCLPKRQGCVTEILLGAFRKRRTPRVAVLLGGLVFIVVLFTATFSVGGVRQGASDFASASMGISGEEPNRLEKSLSQENESSLPFNPQQIVERSRNCVQSAPGMLWVENGSYRAEFDSHGLHFVPKQAGALASKDALSYRLISIRSDRGVCFSKQEEDSAQAAESISACENETRYERPNGIVEKYIAMNSQVEQLFVLNQPLALRGDLLVEGELNTTLRPILRSSEEGLKFLSRSGQTILTYGQAKVCDSAGREIVRNSSWQIGNG
jgi:hypothetical protein